MVPDEILDLALSRHLNAIKTGTASIYDYLRFFQNHYRCNLPHEELEILLPVAALELIKNDPFYLIFDVHGMFVNNLTETDIKVCVDSWSLNDHELAAFLEAHLRMTTLSHEEESSFSVQRALELLEIARPRFGEQKAFLELYSNALQIMGDDRHPEAFDALLDQTSPEWHAHRLTTEMRRAADQEDWPRYDTLRERWAAMPANAHICECEVNFIANIDGLRSLHQGNPDQAIGFLKQSTNVSGCPHLNTGGGTLILAHELLDRNLAKEEVQEHLRLMEQFSQSEETAELRFRL